MEHVPIFLALGMGVFGFFLMVTALVMIGLGGWQRAGQPGSGSRWQLPRRLFLVGAIFSFCFTFLFLMPGVVPWWDYSSPWTNWLNGVFCGFALGILYWRMVWGAPMRGHKAGG